MRKTIAQLEHEDVKYYIGVNDRGVLVNLTIKHEDVRKACWYTWWRKGCKKYCAALKPLGTDHDEFEGLAYMMRINPETALSGQ